LEKQVSFGVYLAALLDNEPRHRFIAVSGPRRPGKAVEISLDFSKDLQRVLKKMRLNSKYTIIEAKMKRKTHLNSRSWL
jgi:hypothetical protein